jgi:rhamnosyltransferase
MRGISIVIRTFNSEVTLPQVLARLPRCAEDEVIIVDSGSTDGTLEIARGIKAKLVEIPAREFTYGRSLNLGFAAARSDWVLSLSSHCIPRPADLLDVYRQAISRFPETIAAAVGPMLYSDLDCVLATGITHYTGSDFEGGFGLGAGNPNCIYRRHIWQQRPFDEIAEASEDYEWYVWAIRNGWSLAVIHSAAVYYRSRGGAKYFFRKGRIDFRAGSRLVKLPDPKLSIVCSHSCKLMLHTVMGKIPYHSFVASFWHYIGTYYESRLSTRRQQLQPPDSRLKTS